jgi:hypothetical protein
MIIKHHSLFNAEQVCQTYSEKDNVEVKYVCTTDLIASDVPVDVFFRDTPHPQFGNRYFGLYYDTRRDATMICNADMVETFEFGVVENDNGELEYSQSHHDYKMFENGNMIDGGRVYIRGSRVTDVYKIKDGEFINTDVVENTMGDLKFTTAQDYVYPGSDPQV